MLHIGITVKQETMTDNKTIDLLTKMQQLMIENIITNNVDSNTLYKLNKIRKNFSSILTTITTRNNSIHIVMTPNQKHGVVISNIEKQNDHVSVYLITVHESGETYQVETVHFNNLIKTIIIKNEEIN